MLSQQRLTGFLVAACGYAMKFAAYGIFTATVLLTFAALLFVYINLAGPDVSFIRYISFALPSDGRGNMTIDEDDIMRIYGLFTIALFVLSVAGKGLWRLLQRILQRIFRPEMEVPANGSILLSNQNPVSSLKRQLLISSLVITGIYLVLFFVIPSAQLAEGTSPLTMYIVFAVFYVIAVISNAIYLGIDTLSNLVLGWAWSRVISG